MPLRRLLPLVVALTVAAACWLGYIGLRDLSLFKVKDVTVKGLSTSDSPAIARALRETAERMTTLHVREDQLRRAVDSFPVVYSVSASADFPNGLDIRVVERIPVAVVEQGDRRVPVAADGMLLPRPEKGLTLPIVQAGELPPAGLLRDRGALPLVRLLGAAPRELRPLLIRAERTKRGFEVEVRDGPVLAFGDDVSRAKAKWAAATRVLADPSAGGAERLDLRLPERPSASGFQSAPEDDGAAPVEEPQP
jgi:cell division protein FtsQ